jgi:hypothetical protein
MLIGLFGLVGMLSIAGCGSSSSGTMSVATNSGAVPTWTQVYTDVIQQRCTPCHTSASGLGVTKGQLDMASQATAYSNLVNVDAAGSGCAGKGIRVVPKMKDSSVLYLKVSLDDPSPCGGKMPLGGTPLAQSEVDMIDSWITAGAVDN